MTKYKAFLIDQDDTLTRHPNKEVYHRGAHRALSELLTVAGRADEIPPFADWQAFHHTLYESNDCHFTRAAEKYRFSRDDFFALMHLHMDDHDIEYDLASVPYLERIAGRALIFTDAGRPWAEKRAKLLGHSLQIFARDDAAAGFERKQMATQRWQVALQMLSDHCGEVLTAPEVLMVDDSAKVLLRARELGFATAHCHWGFPGREAMPGFDYSIGSVGELEERLA